MAAYLFIARPVVAGTMILPGTKASIIPDFSLNPPLEPRQKEAAVAAMLEARVATVVLAARAQVVMGTAVVMAATVVTVVTVVMVETVETGHPNPLAGV